MSDNELEAIRQNKLRELQRKLAAKPKKQEDKSTDDILNRIFTGRAWEVFNTANYQFPHIMKEVKDSLVKLALSGRLENITGEQLYLFLRNLGLRVKLNTTIRYTEHGKLKTLAEKMRE